MIETRHAQSGGRLEVDDLDLAGGFADRPLDASTLRCLRYMHDVESHTVCYLRDVLVTKAHADPAITAFLTAWNYEEHWHGDALGRVLEAHGELAGAERVANVRGGPAGAASLARVDRRVDRLPGLAGLHLLASARAEALAA